jgi:hypothetical protein
MFSVPLGVPLMDPASLVSALVASRTGQVQLAMAGKMLKMNADQAQSVVKLLDAAQGNMDRLANVAAGIGTKLDISI